MARDLRLFYLFRLLATSYFFAPLFVMFMLSRGMTFEEILSLAALYSIVVILVEIPTGALADRIGRRQSMMAGALAMVVSCSVAYGAQTMSTFAVAEVFAAISIALCSGADSAYLYDLLHANGLSHEYARREATASVWHLGGSGVACLVGGILGEVDLSLAYLVTAGSAGLAFVIAWRMGEEPMRGGAQGARLVQHPIGSELRSYLRTMVRALGDVVNSPRLTWIIFYAGVVFVLLKATHYLYQPYLREIGFGIWETGAVFAGVYFLSAFVALNVDRFRTWLGEGALVWGLLAALAVSFVLLNRFAGEWALTMLAIQAVAKGLFSPLVKPIINREITCSSRRATVLSIESIARRLATGVFLPVIGVYGASRAIDLCGLFGLVGLAFLAVTLRYSPAAASPGKAAVDK